MKLLKALKEKRIKKAIQRFYDLHCEGESDGYTVGLHGDKATRVKDFLTLAFDLNPVDAGARIRNFNRERTLEIIDEAERAARNGHFDRANKVLLRIATPKLKLVFVENEVEQ